MSIAVNFLDMGVNAYSSLSALRPCFAWTSAGSVYDSYVSIVFIWESVLFLPEDFVSWESSFFSGPYSHFSSSSA